MAASRLLFLFLVLSYMYVPYSLSHWLHGDVGTTRSAPPLPEQPHPLVLPATSSSVDCARLCHERADCKAWSFCRPRCADHAQLSNVPLCSLKSSVGKQFRSACCSSGVKEVALLQPFWRRLSRGAVQPLGWAREEAKRQVRAALTLFNECNASTTLSCEQKLLRELILLSEQLAIDSLREHVRVEVESHRAEMLQLAAQENETRSFARRQHIWRELAFVPAVLDYFDAHRQERSLPQTVVGFLRLVRQLIWRYPREYRRWLNSYPCGTADLMSAIQDLLMDETGMMLDKSAQFLLSMNSLLSAEVDCADGNSYSLNKKRKVWVGSGQPDFGSEVCALRAKVFKHLATGEQQCITNVMENVVGLLNEKIIDTNNWDLFFSPSGAAEKTHKSVKQLDELGHILDLLMQLFNELLTVTSNTEVADWLEMVAFNFLPATVNRGLIIEKLTEAPQTDKPLPWRNSTSSSASRQRPSLTPAMPCPVTTNGWTRHTDSIVLQSAVDHSLVLTSFVPSETIVRYGERAGQTRLTIRSTYPYGKLAQLALQSTDSVNLHFRIPLLSNIAIEERNGCVTCSKKNGYCDSEHTALYESIFVSVRCDGGNTSLNLRFKPLTQIVRQNEKVTITRGSLLYGTPAPVVKPSVLLNVDENRQPCCIVDTPKPLLSDYITFEGSNCFDVRSEDEHIDPCPEFGLLLSDAALSNPDKHLNFVQNSTPEQQAETALGRLLSSGALQAVGFRMPQQSPKKEEATKLTLESVLLFPHASSCTASPTVFAIVAD